MIEPPPHVLEPSHRDIWNAACQLLQQNMGLTSAGDFCKVSGNSDAKVAKWRSANSVCGSEASNS